MHNIEELTKKEDISKFSEIRQDILNQIKIYNDKIDDVLNDKVRYDILKINTTLCCELVEI
jgi:hypothetical protein